MLDHKVQLLTRIAADLDHGGKAHRGGVLQADMRYDSKLPPLGAQAAARSFADLCNVAAAFTVCRETIQARQKSCSVRRHASREQPRTVTSPRPAAGQFDAGEFTFAACLLSVADPSVPLLSAPDAERCLQMFVERAAKEVSGSANAIASQYSKLRPARHQSACRADAVDMLQRPLRAISDSGLSDAFVNYMARTLRTTIVVRRGGAGCECSIYPPDAAGCSPCVLVGRGDDDGAFHIIMSSSATLCDVQERLAAENPVLTRDITTRHSVTMQDVSKAASVLAVAPMDSGKHRTKSKAALVHEIIRLGGGASNASKKTYGHV